MNIEEQKLIFPRPPLLRQLNTGYWKALHSISDDIKKNIIFLKNNYVYIYYKNKPIDENYKNTWKQSNYTYPSESEMSNYKIIDFGKEGEHRYFLQYY